jgi:electron transport complex protein RnfG
MNNTVRYTLVLTIVCAAAAAGIGGIYILTKEPIRKKAEETESAVRKAVLSKAETFEALGDNVLAGKDAQGNVVGYVATGEAGGYGGKLTVMVGLDADLKIVRAAVLSHNETPGLGAEMGKTQTEDTLWTVLGGGERSKGTSWMDQFGGKKLSQLEVGSGIDAKTGCTITSKAITAAAKAAVEQVEAALKTPGGS